MRLDLATAAALLAGAEGVQMGVKSHQVLTAIGRTAKANATGGFINFEQWMMDLSCGAGSGGVFSASSYAAYSGRLGECIPLPGLLTHTPVPVVSMKFEGLRKKPLFFLDSANCSGTSSDVTVFPDALAADGSCERGQYSYGRYWSMRVTTSSGPRFSVTSDPGFVLGSRPWFARRWFHSEGETLLSSPPEDVYVVEHWLDDIDCGTLPFKSTAYGRYEGTLGSCLPVPGALTMSEDTRVYTRIEKNSRVQSFYHEPDCSDSPMNASLGPPLDLHKPSECQVQEYAGGKLGSIMVYPKSAAPPKTTATQTKGFGRFLNTEPAKPLPNAPTYKTDISHFSTFKLSSMGEPTFTIRHYIGDINCGSDPLRVWAFGEYTGTFSNCLPLPASLTGTPSTVFWVKIDGEGEMTIHYEFTCGLPFTGVSPVSINITSSDCQRQEYKSGRVGSLRLQMHGGSLGGVPPKA